jgi:hypothetical protein
MKRRLSNRRALIGSGVAAILAAALTAAPAVAKTQPAADKTQPAVDTSSCSDPVLSQPFLAWGDQDWYTLAPGESANSFDGTGWTLTGGASIASTTLLDGTTGPVLDLPSGASAVSPSMCVSTDYPTARTLVRNVLGSQGVQFAVAYEGTKTWGDPKTTGEIGGEQDTWTASDPFKLHPQGGVDGWQIVRFTFTAGGKAGDSQLYDFYVDPRMRH